MKYLQNSKKGTALITLLVFTLISTIISSAAITIMVVNTSTTSQTQLGNDTLYIAESGLENAILRFLRNPSYSGETLTINNGTITITVSGTGPYTLRSSAVKGSYSRTVEAVLTYNNNVLTLTSWSEVYN